MATRTGRNDVAAAVALTTSFRIHFDSHFLKSCLRIIFSIEQLIGLKTRMISPIENSYSSYNLVAHLLGADRNMIAAKVAMHPPIAGSPIANSPSPLKKSGKKTIAPTAPAKTVIALPINSTFLNDFVNSH